MERRTLLKTMGLVPVLPLGFNFETNGVRFEDVESFSVILVTTLVDHWGLQQSSLLHRGDDLLEDGNFWNVLNKSKGVSIKVSNIKGRLKLYLRARAEEPVAHQIDRLFSPGQSYDLQAMLTEFDLICERRGVLQRRAREKFGPQTFITFESETTNIKDILGVSTEQALRFLGL